MFDVKGVCVSVCDRCVCVHVMLKVAYRCVCEVKGSLQCVMLNNFKAAYRCVRVMLKVAYTCVCVRC